ncbi:putative phage integrase [Polaromonas sp. CG9_12]|nr:putative phage integrase [Polaromonas sp. CG9_12]
MAKIAFTAGRVAGFKCPPDKKQAFLWDVTAPGLGLRATPAGKPAYVFQSVYQGKDVRLTIGSPAAWSIPDAQAKARELQRLIDGGHDPRGLKRAALAAQAEKQTAAAAAQVQAAAHALTTGEVWAVYLAERRPHWGTLHYADHIRLAKAGGLPANRGTRGRGMTIAGPLYPLMALPLRDLDAPAIETWAAHEAKTRASAARLAWRCLKVFLGWCSEQPAYAALLPAKNPAKTTRSREALGKAGVKQDALLREQLTVWFDAVQRIGNPVTAAYLQTLLLTGARPGEVLGLRWEDLNAKWKGLTIRDKVEGERVIPLTPYVSQLLAALPRRNEFVFSGAAGAMSKPHKPHSIACAVAGIEGLTLHGLRRSFKSLTEWLEVPAGVVAQVMGHKPSATAEKHYTVRPLDLLRSHHEKIEAWILEQAGVKFDALAAPGGLRVVV